MTYTPQESIYGSDAKPFHTRPANLHRRPMAGDTAFLQARFALDISDRRTVVHNYGKQTLDLLRTEYSQQLEFKEKYQR